MLARTFTFLGTGTSAGVPMVGCDCGVCQSTDLRNHRYRCAVVIQTPTGNLLIDTPPELRLQLIRAGVRVVHAILYTHYHADHLFGLDDVRPIPHRLGGPVPIYCAAEVEDVIRKTFGYAFPDADAKTYGFVPQLTFQRITEQPFQVLDQVVTPIPLRHAHFDVFGFRIGDVAYCTDVNLIPERSWPLLEGLDVLVLDALRFRPHPAHFCLNDSLAVVERLKPKRALFTHMSHDVEHEAVSKQLPAGVELAYDGLSFEF